MSEEPKNEEIKDAEIVNEENKPTKIDQKQDRMWAMICHLSALVCFLVWIPGANILGPLIVWAWKKAEVPSVDKHGKEAMNFQICLLIYTVAASLLCFIFIGFLLLPVITIGGIVLVIIAAVKANNGEPFEYPFIFRLIK